MGGILRSWLTADTYQAPEAANDLSIGTDPLTANRYSYVNGDPINLTDPSGHCPAGGPAAAGKDCAEVLGSKSQQAAEEVFYPPQPIRYIEIPYRPTCDDAVIPALCRVFSNQVVQLTVVILTVRGPMRSFISTSKSSLALAESQELVVLANQTRAELGIKRSRNVATARLEVNGESIELRTVSGERRQNRARDGLVEVPANRRFTVEPGSEFDSEVLLLERYAAVLESRGARTGRVALYTERKPCNSCADVIEQFKREYPGVAVDVYYNGPRIVMN